MQNVSAIHPATLIPAGTPGDPAQPDGAFVSVLDASRVPDNDLEGLEEQEGPGDRTLGCVPGTLLQVAVWTALTQPDAFSGGKTDLAAADVIGPGLDPGEVARTPRKRADDAAPGVPLEGSLTGLRDGPELDISSTFAPIEDDGSLQRLAETPAQTPAQGVGFETPPPLQLIEAWQLGAAGPTPVSVLAYPSPHATIPSPNPEVGRQLHLRLREQALVASSGGQTTRLGTEEIVDAATADTRPAPIPEKSAATAAGFRSRLPKPMPPDDTSIQILAALGEDLLGNSVRKSVGGAQDLSASVSMRGPAPTDAASAIGTPSSGEDPSDMGILNEKQKLGLSETIVPSASFGDFGLMVTATEATEGSALSANLLPDALTAGTAARPEEHPVPDPRGPSGPKVAGPNLPEPPSVNAGSEGLLIGIWERLFTGVMVAGAPMTEGAILPPVHPALMADTTELSIPGRPSRWDGNQLTAPDAPADWPVQENRAAEPVGIVGAVPAVGPVQQASGRASGDGQATNPLDEGGLPFLSGTGIVPPGPAPSLGSTHGATPVNVPHIATQMTTALAKSTDGSTDLALAPEELGKVRLKLKPDAGNPDRMVVMITFERPETLELFRRHAGELADALRSAGYAGADIGFGQEGGFASGSDQRGTPSGQPGGQLHADPSDISPAPARHLAGASLDLRL